MVPQKFICVLKITYIFPSKFKIRKYRCTSTNSRSLLLAKDMFFRKREIWRQTIEDEQIYTWRQIVEDEQIYKIFSQLIISTSNATLKVLSLRPCFHGCLWNWNKGMRQTSKSQTSVFSISFCTFYKLLMWFLVWVVKAVGNLIINTVTRKEIMVNDKQIDVKFWLKLVFRLFFPRDLFCKQIFVC